MELDQLQQLWDMQSQKDLTIPDNNLMELIHHKSKGPVATLKKRFRFQLMAFPVFVAFMILNFIKRPALLHDMLIWFFIVAVVALAGYFWFNYTVINRLSQTNTTIKQMIEKDISALENGFKKYFIVSRIVLVLFAILLEVLMHFHKLPDFENWLTYSIFIRIGIYIGAFALHYFIEKNSFKRQYGQHITFLKEMLQKAS